jgi:hypothetical protein
LLFVDDDHVVDDVVDGRHLGTDEVLANILCVHVNEALCEDETSDSIGSLDDLKASEGHRFRYKKRTCSVTIQCIWIKVLTQLKARIDSIRLKDVEQLTIKRQLIVVVQLSS